MIREMFVMVPRMHLENAQSKHLLGVLLATRKLHEHQIRKDVNACLAE